MDGIGAHDRGPMDRGPTGRGPTDRVPTDKVPTRLATVEVDGALTQPSALVAAMLGAGHAAIARIAAGSVWEDETGLVFPPGVEAHAERMALLWQRTARHLQCREGNARQSRAHCSSDPERSGPSEGRTDP